MTILDRTRLTDLLFNFKLLIIWYVNEHTVFFYIIENLFHKFSRTNKFTENFNFIKKYKEYSKDWKIENFQICSVSVEK